MPAKTYPRWFSTRSPVRGRFFVAEWKTPGQGTNLALGTSESQLARLWSHVVKEDPERMTFQAWRMEFVDPPEDIAAVLDAQVFWDAAETFQLRISAAAHGRQVYRARPPRGPGAWPKMPPEFKSCDAYATGPGGGPGRPRSPLDHHQLCVNCAWGLLWTGVEATPEAQKAAWQAALLRPGVLQQVAEVRAPALRERPAARAAREPTHVLLDDFGHHHSGIFMQPMGAWAHRSAQQVLSFVAAEPARFPNLGVLHAGELRELKRRKVEEDRRRKRESEERDAAEVARDEQALRLFLAAVPGRGALHGDG